jgi:CheY-like chemotaxis protein
LELNKIMVVDDNASFRQLMVTMLTSTAREYIECSEGRDAVACYGRHRPELVLMDLEMKGMDGITATRQIKSQFPEAKVLIISQHDDPDLRAEAERAGACGYVVKDDLLAVKRFIETQSQ